LLVQTPRTAYVAEVARDLKRPERSTNGRRTWGLATGDLGEG
jgi:hypothetical protein